MWLKAYANEVCPQCGKADCAERISRRAWDRWFVPNAKRMKCRLCLQFYLVAKSTAKIPPVSTGLQGRGAVR